MQPVGAKALDLAMQLLAHDICNTIHPDDQIHMSGWLTHEGQFIVSCAHCKMKVYNFYRKEVNA